MKRSQYRPVIVASALAFLCACSQENTAATTSAPAAVASANSARLEKTTVLAQDLSVGGLVATDDAVFFSTSTNVSRVPATGGPTTASFSTKPFPGVVAVTNEDVVLDETGSDAVNVRSVLAKANAPVALCQGVPKDERPFLDKPAFVADAENVYWRSIKNLDSHPNTPRGNLSTIYRCPRAGGPAVVVAKNVKAGSWGALALSGRQLLVASEVATLRSVSLVDGSVKDLVVGSGRRITSVASDGEYAYFADAGTPMPEAPSDRYNDGSIQRVRLIGGETETLSAGLNWPEYLVVDSTSAYWTTRDKKLKRGKKTGGGVEVLAAPDQYIEAIAVNKNNIYWTLGGTSENAHRDGMVLGRAK